MTRLIICFALGASLGACAGGRVDTTTPEGCFKACEQECPGKGSTDATFEKYISCVERCETKCGVESEE